MQLVQAHNSAAKDCASKRRGMNRFIYRAFLFMSQIDQFSMGLELRQNPSALVIPRSGVWYDVVPSDFGILLIATGMGTMVFGQPYSWMWGVLVSMPKIEGCRQSNGRAAQQVRLLPGTSTTSSTSTWVVLNEGCSLANPEMAPCFDERGNTFLRNASSTWSTNRLANAGLFELLMISESQLGLSGNAYFGFDTLSLNASGRGHVQLTDQLVAGYATNDFWLGSFPLSPYGMNFTDMRESVPSLLASMADTNLIPSRSWAYSAGAHYRGTSGFASLILGGFDRQRIQGLPIQIPFAQDISRDLVIRLQSISYDTYGSDALMVRGINVFIDSLVPHLWLPVEVCQQFEAAFNLTWNSDTELYLLDDATHSKLVEQNPTFTFSLVSPANASQAIDIKLPFSAFDLNVSAPIVNDTTWYFPLKRAANDTQYTLGRTFLQEAYLIADYERRTFDLSQVAYSNTTDVKDIFPPSSETPPEEPVQTSSNHGISSGAIAGIVVGVVVLMGLIAIFACLWRRRRHNMRQEIERKDLDATNHEKEENIENNTSELPIDEGGVFEAEGRAVAPELEASDKATSKHEMANNEVRPELESKAVHDGITSKHEMANNEVRPELESRAIYELSTER